MRDGDDPRLSRLNMPLNFAPGFRACSVAVARLLGHRNLFTARVAGHETDTGVTLLQWEAANGVTLRLPQQSELAAGQLVQWMIAPQRCDCLQ